MSMLAERKQKQKWTLNPRGKYWSDDSNKFGQRMLEKMGWSTGKGLGANEDGITEHLKPAYKNDSKGIGYEDKEDQWTTHEDNFSSLLQNLGNTRDIEVKKSEVSLEKKSQSSRARVHYHKFTRSKDLSRYTDKDLANIFGRKTLEKKSNIESTNQDSNSNSSDSNKDFVNSGSMTDYFKNKFKGFFSKTSNELESDDERPGFGLSLDNAISTGDLLDDNKDTIFKSKMLHVINKSSENNSNENIETLNIDTPEENDKDEVKMDKNKRKKSKIVINGCFDNPGFTDFPETGQKIILKKNKKRKLEIIVEESNYEHNKSVDVEHAEEHYAPLKKKSKSSKEPKEDGRENEEKLNDKKHEIQTNNKEIVSFESFKNKNSSKKKKKVPTDFGICNVACTELGEENILEESFNESKSSTKKKKKAVEYEGIINVACDVKIQKEPENLFEVKSSKKKKYTKDTGITNFTRTELNYVQEENITEESLDLKSSTKKKKKRQNEVGIYNVACTEDDKTNTSTNTEGNKILEIKTVIKSSKKKRRSDGKGIYNAACAEGSYNESNVSTAEPADTSKSKESKKVKKKKLKAKGVDNLACTANTEQQNIEEEISTMSNAIDDYQLELENQMNERKALEKKGEQRKQSRQFRSANQMNERKAFGKKGEQRRQLAFRKQTRPVRSASQMNERRALEKKGEQRKPLAFRKQIMHFKSAKTSIKRVIQGELRYNFEGSNLSHIPGYGVER